eukprot:7025769-Pyramimonas_sp.AAC.1
MSLLQLLHVRTWHSAASLFALLRLFAMDAAAATLSVSLAIMRMMQLPAASSTCGTAASSRAAVSASPTSAPRKRAWVFKATSTE